MFMHSVRPAWEICLSIQIALASSRNDFTKLDTLLDLGTNTIFSNKPWAEKHKVLLTSLWNSISVYNVDGTWNSTGSITHAVELIVKFQGHREKIMAEVKDLGKNSFILGFSWLKCHSQDIDWTKGTVKITHLLELLVLIRCRENSKGMNQWGRTLTWCLILLQVDWGAITWLYELRAWYFES